MIRAGFIGTGGISGVHLRYLASREDVEIAALCDVSAENLKKRQKEYGGRTFADFREMLDGEKLDAVWLCTPPNFRREPLLECAERGIAVFCEKPVERTSERAFEIARQLSSRDAKVQVGYCFRPHPVVTKLREEMEGDRVHLVQSFYGCDVSLRGRLPRWFYDKSLSGGALVDQATHNFDLLRYLLGEVVELVGLGANPVRAKEPGYTIEETISLSFRFESGVLGSHIHTWVGDAWRNEIVFSGEKRLYRLSWSPVGLVVEDREGEEGKKRREYDFPGLALHQPQNEVFVGMIESGDWSAAPSDYADGARSLALVLAANRAVETGAAKVEFPELP